MIEILVELADIPSGALIRKLTGTTTYQVQRTLAFRSLADKLTQVNAAKLMRIKAETGAVFLFPRTGPDRIVRACSSDKRVVWLNAGGYPDVLEQRLREEGLIRKR